MPITEEQKKTVREAMLASAEKRKGSMRDRAIFEEKRNARAYELTEANLAARAKAKAEGKPLPAALSWSDAQAQADRDLEAPAKPAKEAPAPAATKSETKP